MRAQGGPGALGGNEGMERVWGLAGAASLVAAWAGEGRRVCLRGVRRQHRASGGCFCVRSSVSFSAFPEAVSGWGGMAVEPWSRPRSRSYSFLSRPGLPPCGISLQT